MVSHRHFISNAVDFAECLARSAKYILSKVWLYKNEMIDGVAVSRLSRYDGSNKLFEFSRLILTCVMRY
jgi:hypothetical protein